jgi:hypothetical protein
MAKYTAAHNFIVGDAHVDVQGNADIREFSDVHYNDGGQFHEEKIIDAGVFNDDAVDCCYLVYCSCWY